MPAGRPTEYNTDIAAKVCSMLADGVSLRTVCMSEDMPAKTTVFKWLRDNEEFANQYAHAKEQSTIAQFEDMLSIADEDPLEPLIDKEGLPVIVDGVVLKTATKTSIDHARLRIETRKWALAKMLPKKYGDRIHTEHSGKVELSSMDDDELDRIIRERQQALEKAGRD